MKNKIITLLLAIPMLAATACNQWLDVSPRTERKKDELFSSQQGFQDALTGIYIQMGQRQAYGANLTYYAVDCMGSIYDATASSVEYNLRAHNWTDSNVEILLNSTFAKLYKIISSANSLLEEIDGRKDVFSSQEEFGIIKGEALAIRAMCHLDLLRLFGPVPAKADQSRILPYVTTFGRQLTEHITWAEYTKLLLQDLADAEKLLEQDPIHSTTFRTENTFFTNRQYRFNYYAVKALQARTNLWIGNPADALAAAETVISATYDEVEPVFTLGNASAFASGDLLFTSEHIMALYNFSLSEKYSTYFSQGKLYKGNAYSRYIKSDLYGSSGVDIREPEIGKWWDLYVSGIGINSCISNKYFTDNSTDANIGYRIPLLRLSEMYLIAAETAPLSKAQAYYDVYLKSRNLSSVPLGDEGRMQTLRKEYLKEFYAEGYIFYLYKRLDSPASDILWAPNGLKPDYVLPKPSDELVYGN